MRVIDLGCGSEGRSTTALAPHTWEIVGLDRLPAAAVAHRHPRFTYKQGDATDLSAFGDGTFDLAISVGLLEHLTEPAAFAAAASEIQRVARQYALVVPFRYAWIEPHYFVPFFPVLPRRVQNGFVRLFNLYGQAARVRADPTFIERRVRWRSNAEYRAAFPGSRTLLTPTKETVAIVLSSVPTGNRGHRTAIRRASRRRTFHSVATRIGILPALETIVRARLEAAILEVESRRSGAVDALDAGCGRRSALAPLRDRLDRFVGTDLHVPEPPLAYLDDFVAADLCSPDPPISPEAFDLVLSHFTIEHFVDPKAALANLYRALRPGGHIVVTTVNRRNPLVGAYLALPARLQRRLQPLVKRPGAKAHRLVGACNDPSSLRAALTAAGFEAIGVETVGNLARSWGPRLPTFLLGLLGDRLTQGIPSRRSTIVATARKLPAE
jgi:SAM-dependent methyltransferase